MTTVVPPVIAQCLRTPGAFRADELDWPDTRPGCCMQIDNAQWGRLMARMMENGMVELRQPVLWPGSATLS